MNDAVLKREPELEASRPVAGALETARETPRETLKLVARALSEIGLGDAVGPSDETDEPPSLGAEELSRRLGAELCELVDRPHTARTEPAELIVAELIELLERQSTQKKGFVAGNPEEDAARAREPRADAGGETRARDADGDGKRERFRHVRLESLGPVHRRAALAPRRLAPELGFVRRRFRPSARVTRKHLVEGGGRGYDRVDLSRPAGLEETLDGDVHDDSR